MILLIISSLIVILGNITLHSYVVKYLKNKYEKINQLILIQQLTHFDIFTCRTNILVCYIIFLFNKTFPFLGTFSGTDKYGFLDLFYYSFNCYTTLGMGYVFATGLIRITAVIESLIGLIMIAWSASLLLSILLNKTEIT